MADDQQGIVLLGLGPGDPNLLTRQAWQVLENADEIYLRTADHPTVAELPKQLKIHTFDHLYETADSFEDVYAAIVKEILALGGMPGGVIYAVPGHPFVAEATAPEIARQARSMGLPVRVIEGLSFIDAIFGALGLDPLPNTTIIDALDVARLHIPAFPPHSAALIAQLYSRQIASDVKLTLMEVYPDDHPVCLVHAAGLSAQAVEECPLHQIDHSKKIGLLTSLYVPPLGPETSFEAFQEVIARLRAPDGCPWDREQTHLSLRPYLLEETYEVLAALDSQDMQSLKEELGDLLLQIVLHTQIATENGDFNMPKVLEYVNTKLVFRHPHVFGDVNVDGVEGVLSNWEMLKAREREQNGKAKDFILDGVPAALPALVQAEQFQRRAARTGFKWPGLENVLQKIREELDEVTKASTPDEQRAEVGDLLFAAVNLAIWFNCDPESALREANLRFRQRFEYLERQARDLEKPISELSIDEMLAYWDEAKRRITHDE